ncbi:MAG: M48 family metalloprotease [Aigarchaeota archaeon]|nr:M48 family metalloprotease [Aigarchaeota archaeon]
MEFPKAVPLRFAVQTEVASAYLDDLLMFIYQKYITPFYTHFANVRRWTLNGNEVLAFTFLDAQGLWSVDVEATIANPVEVKMTPIGAVPRKVLSRLKEDLIITIQMFEEKIRGSTLYFAWVPDKGAVPEKSSDRKRKVISRIFLGNMLVFFVIFIVLSYAVFFVTTELFGVPVEYFPVVLVAIQFVMVLFSDKIVKTMGDWPITASSPHVHVLQYHIPPEQFGTFRQNGTKDTLLRIKKEIHDKTLAFGRPIDGQAAQEAFHNYGLDIRPENLLTKTINVYDIVKEAASRFSVPMPKIMLSNVIIPNAAATGPSPRFGLVLITTGLLVQLDEEEILAVVGHEMSHVKRRDPLVLFALVSAEYLLRVYYLWHLLFYFGFLYFFLVLGAVYFVAKFFEARADLDSAIRMGRPEILAGALRKIGYRRIQLERFQSNRLGSWLGWNPHPPVSFRVERLESLTDPQNIRHPFIQSIKDCVRGLIAELRIF